MTKYYFTIQLLVIGLISSAQASLAQVTIDQPNLFCSPGECGVLVTTYTPIKATTDYTIASVPFSPTFPFVGGITLNANADDVWSPVVNLPFEFNFYGNCYNALSVGSNGVITFDSVNQASGCPWSFNQTIPNPAFPIKNAIYGVYQDTNISSPPVTNPAFQNVNYYVLDTGVNAAPNMVFVINFNELPQYQCNASVGLQTSQIVIYQTTNIIDIIVKNRTACTAWNSGSGLIGIQNQAGTSALAAPGRNTGTWFATNEQWRITPNGGDLPVTYTWYSNAVILPSETSSTLTICPTENQNYSVAMSVGNCTTPTMLLSNTISDLLVPDPGFSLPNNLSVCAEASTSVYLIDLEVNTAYVLSTVNNPMDYVVEYYDTLSDAQIHNNNNIINTTSYEFTQNKMIYAHIKNEITGCAYIKAFEISIIPVVTPPTGAPNQNFTAGQTLADLSVSGQSIIWYDAPTLGNILPGNTLLQDNTTYYATQTISGCESNRSVNSNRLAVTTNLVLSTEAFNTNIFSVYPNPVYDKLLIAAQEDLNSISIYNAIGQEIFHSNPAQATLEINTSTLRAGIYFLRMNTMTQSQTVKIIKN